MFLHSDDSSCSVRNRDSVWVTCVHVKFAEALSVPHGFLVLLGNLRGFVSDYVVPSCFHGSLRWLCCCCVTTPGSPRVIKVLVSLLERGRCWAACWSCYCGFEELFSMVTSACDVKAVTSSTRWSRSFRARWRAMREEEERFSNWWSVLNRRISACPLY